MISFFVLNKKIVLPCRGYTFPVFEGWSFMD
jgi:hypothetical protein